MLDIKIYQINLARDRDNVAFRDLDELMRFQGSAVVKSRIYDKVFEGSVDAQSLEDIYRIFNQNIPKGFRGHSMSTSDVVEIQTDGNRFFYFCRDIGFKQIAFDPRKTQSILQEDNDHKLTPGQNIMLWARLGVSISATAEDLWILQSGGKAAKDKLLELVRSDQCVLRGETYFPGMANERYFSEDIEFSIGPYALHPEKEQGPVMEVPSVETVPAPEAEATVYRRAASYKEALYSGTHEDCLAFCEAMNWEYKDENDFVWDLELEDHLELEKVSTPAVQSLPEQLSFLAGATLIEYKGIQFDEWTIDAETGSVYGEMCERCAEKYKDLLSQELSDGAIGACSVKGCDVVGWDEDTSSHYYVDFQPALIKVIERDPARSSDSNGRFPDGDPEKKESLSQKIQSAEQRAAVAPSQDPAPALNNDRSNNF